MLNKLKNLFKKPPETKPEIVVQPTIKKPRKPREKKVKVELTEKEIATQKGEPYVNVIRMEIDPDDINSGSFELDWNDKFILNLIRAGYKMSDKDTDTDIIDRWWSEICRNILLELYDQKIADPSNRDMRTIKAKDIGNGRTEVS